MINKKENANNNTINGKRPRKGRQSQRGYMVTQNLTNFQHLHDFNSYVYGK